MARRSSWSRAGWLMAGGLFLAGCRGEPSVMERNPGPAQSETFQEPGTPPPDRSNPLIGAWTMDPSGRSTNPAYREMLAVFRPDGTGYDNEGRFRWEMRNPQQVWLYHAGGGSDGVDLDPGAGALRDQVTLRYHNSTFITGLRYYRLKGSKR